MNRISKISLRGKRTQSDVRASAFFARAWGLVQLIASVSCANSKLHECGARTATVHKSFKHAEKTETDAESLMAVVCKRVNH